MRRRSPPARPANDRMSSISLASPPMTANCRMAVVISGSCRCGFVTSNVPVGWAHGIRIETHTRTGASAFRNGTPAAAPSRPIESATAGSRAIPARRSRPREVGAASEAARISWRDVAGASMATWIAPTTAAGSNTAASTASKIASAPEVGPKPIGHPYSPLRRSTAAAAAMSAVSPPSPASRGASRPATELEGRPLHEPAWPSSAVMTIVPAYGRTSRCSRICAVWTSATTRNNHNHRETRGQAPTREARQTSSIT